MRALRLQHRLVIPFVAVAVAGTAAASLVALSVSSNALRSRVQTQLVSAAAVVGRQEFALNPAVLLRFQEVIGAHVITFDDQGRVVASTVQPDRQDLVATVSRAVLPAAGNAVRTLWMDCGVPCLVVSRGVDGRPGSVVALVAETTDVGAASRAVSRTILLAAGLSVIVMVLVSQAIVRRVTGPLQRLVDFARESSPNDSRRIEATGDDEIGAVAVALNGMLDRLEQARVALVRSEKLGLAGLMAARVAHDIRNPLSSIKMQTQLLRARYQGDADAHEMTSSVLHDIQQVESVIQDLLELARPGELRLEPMSVNLVVRDALRQLSAQFSHRRIAVDATLDDQLPHVLLDALRFKQVLLNVLNNAAEAMPRGGAVRVISRLDGDGAVCLQICDDGTGIDPQILERVFDPFVSTKRDGMGLGLVNAKAVVHSHGGSIALENRRPRGACATITLPPASRAAGASGGAEETSRG